MAEPASARPSRGRWYVLLLISVMYLITYLDRVNISTAAPQISKEFGFDKVTMGVIFSAFVWAYALFQVPGGWLSDRFGARGVLTGVVTYWSVMTAATAAAFSATSFIFVRFMFGVGEAGAFPGATRAMQLWYPQRERGLVQGVTHSASRFGAAIAPPIVVLIMSQFGWRPVFYICGATGLLWSLWWGLTYRNLPEEHALVDKAELETIRGIGANGAINPPPMQKQTQVPWLTLRSLEYVGDHVRILYLCLLPVDFPRALATVLSDRGAALHAHSRSALYASLPLFAGVIGDTVGGVATDWLLKKTGSAKKSAAAAVAITGLLWLRYLHRTGGADRKCLCGGVRPDRVDVLSGMHHRPVVGGANGYRRQIFRNRDRHDEHGGQFRRRYFPNRIRRIGARRQLAGALYRCRRPAGRRRCRVGLLARPR